MREHLKNNDFVVLYRTNAQSRAIEDALRKREIAEIYGGLSFYQRKNKRYHGLFEISHQQQR